MKKEEFVKGKSDIENQISQLKNKAEQLKLNYIEENRRFNVGDRIKNISQNEFGFIHSFDIDWKNDIKYICKKEKKDGTPSLQSMYIYYMDNLEIANKSK